MQRVLPPYRAGLFDALAGRCQGGMSVLAGQPAPWEEFETTDRLEAATLARARNRHALQGPLAVWWQEGLTRWLESWDPDALVLEANPRCLSTGPAVRWMRARRRPVLGWGLGMGGVSGRLESLRRRRRRRFVNRFDGMLAYSTLGASQYRSAGLADDQVFVCKNAVAPRPAFPPPPRPAAFRGRPTVLYVGRLVAHKRTDDLIRACALVARDAPELAPELRIVGSGPSGDGLAALAREVYPSTRLPGAAEGAALAAEFARADLFVLPGPGGLAVQEAMSHGLPVIVGEGDGTQQDLVGASNGWHVGGTGPAELAGIIGAALADVERLRRMGEASYEIVAREINSERLVDAIVHALNRTISHQSRGAASQ